MIAPAVLWNALQTLAPLELAADWDNVGLLLEPVVARPVSRLLLTIDLTEPVLAEALQWRADAIVAYHPLIFRGLQRVTSADRVGRAVARLLTDGVYLYAPHTALDAAEGGMNDWLVEALGPLRERRALAPCPARPEDATVGMGRWGRLRRPLGLEDGLAAIKAHLGLNHVRVAPGAAHRAGSPLETLAVCPGSGGDLLRTLPPVDLVLTGEMGHHDILAHNARGATVVLTDHTNTERGYLPVLAERLRRALGEGVSVLISEEDRDPLVVS